MHVGSTFSGIGGLDLGLERAGMRVAFQAESDEWCRGVLAHRFPGVPCYHDVQEVAVPREEVMPEEPPASVPSPIRRRLVMRKDVFPEREAS